MIKDIINGELINHQRTIAKVIDLLQEDIHQAAELVVNTLKTNKIIVFGNGGSASDAQHIAAELTGRFKKERRGLPCIAITTDTSALTAIGNDFGFDQVFSRQIEAIAQEGDLLIGISTSGNSKNVVNGFRKGEEIGCKSIGLSGNSGGAMTTCCNLNIIIPSNDTPRIQEMHILIGHIFCHLVDEILF